MYNLCVGEVHDVAHHCVHRRKLLKVVSGPTNTVSPSLNIDVHDRHSMIVFYFANIQGMDIFNI